MRRAAAVGGAPTGEVVETDRATSARALADFEEEMLRQAIEASLVQAAGGGGEGGGGGGGDGGGGAAELPPAGSTEEAVTAALGREAVVSAEEQQAEQAAVLASLIGLANSDADTTAADATALDLSEPDAVAAAVDVSVDVSDDVSDDAPGGQATLPSSAHESVPPMADEEARMLQEAIRLSLEQAQQTVEGEGKPAAEESKAPPPRPEV